jgi:hypothetical protein
VVVASAFVWVVKPFCASRVTIHHSECAETQGKSGPLGHESGRGERLAMKRRCVLPPSATLLEVEREETGLRSPGLAMSAWEKASTVMSKQASTVKID